MAGGRGDRGMCGRGSQDVVGGKRDREQYGGDKVSGSVMWL